MIRFPRCFICFSRTCSFTDSFGLLSRFLLNATPFLKPLLRQLTQLTFLEKCITQWNLLTDVGGGSLRSDRGGNPNPIHPGPNGSCWMNWSIVPYFFVISYSFVLPFTTLWEETLIYGIEWGVKTPMQQRTTAWKGIHLYLPRKNERSPQSSGWS